jgi:hypothetical protein
MADLDISTKKVLLDQAVVYSAPSGVDMETATVSTLTLLGLTEGGVSFTAEPTVRDIPFDGAKGREIKGMQRILGWKTLLSVTALEFTDENLTGALLTKTVGTKYNKYTPKSGVIATADYKDLVVVGKSSDNKEFLIVVRNAFNGKGLDITQADSDEGKFNIEYHGTYVLNEDLTDKTLPFEILTPVAV